MSHLAEELDILGATIEMLKATTKVQSVLCSKKRFKTAEEAKKWVTSHGFKASKIDTTDQYYRFRQFDPGKCKDGTLRTISLTKGVKAIICIPK
jgi:hypothetical protein